MRLCPPEVEIGPEEGFSAPKDIFGRRELGNKFTRIVQALDGSAVLVLDAPWGTGKTTFVKMWRGQLANAGVPSIYFDAFANDYHEDAFLALAGEIIARAEELEPRAKKAIVTFKKHAARVAKTIARASLHVAIHAATAGLASGKDVDEATRNIADAASGQVDKALDDLLKERLESHRADRLAFEGFAQALRALIHAMAQPRGKPEQTATPQGKSSSTVPLVFIIDELDRCRPPFALALLEKIKHFFAIEGVIFLLVTNLDQLEAAVRLAYPPPQSRSVIAKTSISIIMPG